MIEKYIKIKKLEIVGDFRHIQCLLTTQLLEDGVVLSEQDVRLPAKAPDQDITDMPPVKVGNEKIPLPQRVIDQLQLTATNAWTQEIKDAWAAFKAGQETF